MLLLGYKEISDLAWINFLWDTIFWLTKKVSFWYNQVCVLYTYPSWGLPMLGLVFWSSEYVLYWTVHVNHVSNICIIESHCQHYVEVVLVINLYKKKNIVMTLLFSIQNNQLWAEFSPMCTVHVNRVSDICIIESHCQHYVEVVLVMNLYKKNHSHDITIFCSE
jgi:hypothetical protein